MSATFSLNIILLHWICSQKFNGSIHVEWALEFWFTREKGLIFSPSKGLEGYLHRQGRDVVIDSN